MDDAEDVQDAPQSVESQTPPQKPPSPMLEDDPEPQNNVKNAIIVEDTVEPLPEGCPDTPMHRNSYKCLREARDAATEDPAVQYSSLVVRIRMNMGLSRSVRGMKPRFYQEDCAEAFLLGLNTGLICPTGSGKTEAFVLPLFADHEKKSKIIIISPLNALQDDHAKRFQRYTIPAAAVNGQTYCDELHKSLEQGKIRAIITSPEMAFKHKRFSKFLRNANWMFNVLGVVIDEAHCVLEWGKEFRTEFDNLDSTRAYMASKPLFFCTATLTPSMLDELMKKLSFPKRHFIVNLGCERHNVLPIVSRLKGPTDFAALDFLLEEALADPPRPLVPTLVYAEERETVLYMWLYLMSKLPADSPCREQVEFLMATRDEIVKTIVLAKFILGKVLILCSTEAAGMGIDARVRRVVQFGVPRSLLEWQQHAGRAGRDGEPSYAILLAEPSVFQVVVRKEPKKPAKGKGKGKGKGKAKAKPVDKPTDEKQAADSQIDEETVEEVGIPPEGPTKVQDVRIKEEASEVSLSPQLKRKRALEDLADEDTLEDQEPEDQALQTIPETADLSSSEVTDKLAAQQASLEGQVVEYRKQVDEDMRELCMTLNCRREVTMKSFNSPPPMREMNVSCCDNCLLSKGDRVENPITLSEYDANILKMIDSMEERLRKKPLPPKVVIPMPSAEPGAKPIKRRVKDHYNNVKEALEVLRFKFWRDNYGDTMFTAVSVLPDKVLSALASEAKIVTLEDLKVALPEWDFAEEMGATALATIAEADARWIAQNEAKKKKRADVRKADSAAKKIKRDEDNLIAKRRATEERKAAEHAEAVKNWTTYKPAATAPTTPMRSLSPAHPLPTPPHHPALQTSPLTPAHAYYYHTSPVTPTYTQYHNAGNGLMAPPTLVPQPGSSSSSTNAHNPPVAYPYPYSHYYQYPTSLYYPSTPIRPPSAPGSFVLPTPPFTPSASSSRLPPQDQTSPTVPTRATNSRGSNVP